MVNKFNNLELRKFFPTLTKQVAAVLEKCPEARSNDWVLIFKVVTIFYGAEYYEDLISFSLSASNRFPSIESITRARRTVQSLREDLCDSETKKRRMMREEEFHDYFSQESNEIDEELEDIDIDEDLDDEE